MLLASLAQSLPVDWTLHAPPKIYSADGMCIYTRFIICETCPDARLALQEPVMGTLLDERACCIVFRYDNLRSIFVRTERKGDKPRLGDA